MSTCISRHGEWSDHILDDAYTCTRCLVLDEDALVDELRRVRRLHDDAVAGVEEWRRTSDIHLAAMEAARPVVEAAAEITASGDMPTTLMWVRLATAVDLYRSATSDHPSTTEEKP